MSQVTLFYPALPADDRGTHVASHAGSLLLTATAATVGLDDARAATLTPWRAPRAVHHPGKVSLDLAVSIAIGGGRAVRPRRPTRRTADLRGGGL